MTQQDITKLAKELLATNPDDAMAQAMLNDAQQVAAAEAKRAARVAR